MKQPIHPLFRTLARTRALAGRLWRRLWQQPETSVLEEIGSGALIGWGACIVLSWGFSPLLMAGAALCGLCVGSAIGLLLWTGSAVIPEEHIAPPARSEKRADGAKLDRYRPPEP